MPYIAYPGQSIAWKIGGKYAGAAQDLEFTALAWEVWSDLSSPGNINGVFAAQEAVHPEWFKKWTKAVPGSATPLAFSTESPTFQVANVTALKTYHVALRIKLTREGTLLFAAVQNVIQVTPSAVSEITVGA